MPYFVLAALKMTIFKDKNNIGFGQSSKCFPAISDYSSIGDSLKVVTPVEQATEMVKSEIKREREMAERKTFVPPGRRKNVHRSIPEDYL